MASKKKKKKKNVQVRELSFTVGDSEKLFELIGGGRGDDISMKSRKDQWE